MGYNRMCTLCTILGLIAALYGLSTFVVSAVWLASWLWTTAVPAGCQSRGSGLLVRPWWLWQMAIAIFEQYGWDQVRVEPDATVRTRY